MKEVINIMEKLINILKMDSNAFYPMLVTGFSLIITVVFEMLNGNIKWQDRKLLTRLYYKSKLSMFYTWFIFWEVANLFLGCFVAVLISSFIYFFFRKINEYTNFIYLAGIFIGSIFSFLFTKIMWVRKNIMGVKKRRAVLFVSIILFYAMFILDALGKRGMVWIFSFGYIIIEIIGLILFRVNYVEYRHSKVKYYLDDGSQIVCENIEKLKGKRKHIIIENEDNALVIPYERIERAEYFGEPKIILQNKKKVCRKRIKKDKDKYD